MMPREIIMRLPMKSRRIITVVKPPRKPAISSSINKTDRQNLLIGMDDENYKTTYYSVPQKDYVYDGYGVAPWIIKIKDGDSNNHKLINVLTDEELLSGCYVFSSYTDKNGNVYFIVSYEDQKICYRLKQ